MLSSVVPSENAKWEVKEVPTPQPCANQVLIKIHESGICYTDVDITCYTGSKISKHQRP